MGGGFVFCLYIMVFIVCVCFFIFEKRILVWFFFKFGSLFCKGRERNKGVGVGLVGRIWKELGKKKMTRIYWIQMFSTKTIFDWGEQDSLRQNFLQPAHRSWGLRQHLKLVAKLSNVSESHMVLFVMACRQQDWRNPRQQRWEPRKGLWGGTLEKEHQLRNRLLQSGLWGLCSRLIIVLVGFC